MKQTKKLMAILCVCLGALAVGCGSSEPATETPAQTEAPAANTEAPVAEDAAEAPVVEDTAEAADVTADAPVVEDAAEATDVTADASVAADAPAEEVADTTEAAN